MHWGAEIVLRYWSEIHNREVMMSKGSLITICYGDAYDNAFWNGTAMTYDGSYKDTTDGSLL
jgi:Zn-dependent metalloprotease